MASLWFHCPVGALAPAGAYTPVLCRLVWWQESIRQAILLVPYLFCKQSLTLAQDGLKCMCSVSLSQSSEIIGVNLHAGWFSLYEDGKRGKGLPFKKT